jgi:transposase-like protein
LGKVTAGRIVRHGFYRTKWGRRRRYRCQACGKTFCTSTETPYYRLQHRRATFDEVAGLSVEGLNKSAISRVKRIAWNTVDRWLARAAESCYRFNDRKITGLDVEELQADEIRTIVGSKKKSIWVFATIEGRVSALAFDRRRQTELPKHAHAFSRRCEAHESPMFSASRHRRL